MLMISTFAFNAVANFALGLGVAWFLGAEQFGIYALIVAGGMVLQTLLFEWLRLSANRFYGQKQAADDPNLYATLNLGTGLTAIVLSGLAVILYFTGGAFGVAASVAALGPLVGIAGGLFDYRCAIARARFDNRRYAAIVVVKNALALVLMLGGAFWLRQAEVVVIGLCVSALSGVLVSARAFASPAGNGRFDRLLMRQFALYAGPMVISSLIYHLNMFMTRSGVALHYGLAESGRYSLALDIGLKLVATVGSALDILLFQLAVRAEAEGSEGAAKTQLGLNLLIITGILAPVCAGFWLILPSFEALFINESYHAAYTVYTLYLLPGLFAFGLAFYAITPLFQIARKTWPVLVAAFANISVAAGILYLIPGGDGSHGALATSSGFIAGTVLMAIMAWKTAPVAVPWRDLAKIAVAVAAMYAAVQPALTLPPGAGTLALTALAGGIVYLGAALTLNTGRLRSRVLARLRPAGA